MTGQAVAERRPGHAAPGGGNRWVAAHWGARSTWAFTGLLLAYNAAYVALALTGPREWRGVEDYLQTWSVLEFLPQMLGLVALPLLGLSLVAAHQLVHPSRQVFSLAAVIAGAAFLTVVWVGYLVQVAWLLPALQAGSTGGVELLAWRSMASPGWAVNVAGWTLSGAMGCALAAAVTGGPIATRVRLLFATYGAAQLLLIPWLALDATSLGAPIALSWLVVLPLATGHLAAWMRNEATGSDIEDTAA